MTGERIAEAEAEGGGLKPVRIALIAPRRRRSRVEILAEIRRHAQTAPRPLSERNFVASRPRVSLGAVRGAFGSYLKACEAAGLDTGTMRRNYTDEDVLAAFEDVCRDRLQRGFDGPPSLTDFDRFRRRHGRGPCSAMLKDRFGSYPGFLRVYDLYQGGQIDRAELLERARRPAPAPRRRMTWRLRAETLHRFASRCQACGRAAVDLDRGERLEVDHIRPVAMGGGDEPENLTVRCTPCNRGKGARFVG